MKYLHPDVLDNGHALIQAAAVRAILIPSFSASTTYSQVVASAILTATISSADFTISNEGTGRKIVFGGKTGQADLDASLATDLHVAYTDGLSRVLWVEPITPDTIIAGQSYSLPAQTLISQQPQ